MATRPPLNFCTVLQESKRIVNAHSRHFLALSVLFLLPLSFSIIVYPTVEHLLLHSTKPNTQILFLIHNPLQLHQPSIIPTNTLLLNLLYTLFVLTFFLCAFGSIIYSVFHGFYGRPVKLISAIKSIFSSFLPLLATVVVSQIIVFGIVVIFGIFLFLVIRGSEPLGFQIDLNSPYFIGFSVVVLLVLVSVLVYLQMNWALVYVVVVVESSWGFEPLRRSTYLIKGLRRVAFSLLLYFGFFAGFLVWNSSLSAMRSGGAGDDWKSWAFILEIVMTSTLLMVMLLTYAAANTVFYMYCKAIQGELAGEIVEEFAREYVSLPFDDEKVPHVVSVVYT